MRLILLLAGALMMTLAGCGNDEPIAGYAPAASEDGITVYFSPQTDCKKLVIDQIRSARKYILVQAYSFDSERIAKALVDAKKMGVNVSVILDAEKADDKSEKDFLVKRGISTYVDAAHEKAHSKVILIDGTTIITGSFNFSDGDKEGTADNVVIITNKPKLIEAYETNFKRHLAHAEKQKE